MKNILLAIIGFIQMSFLAQTNVNINFHWMANNAPFGLNQNFTNQEGKVTIITDVALYYSGIQFEYDGGQMAPMLDTVLYVSTTKTNFPLGVQPLTNIENIHFGVGVPQALNHLDISLYDLHESLSYKQPAMHWGWTSGYFFFGVIGKVDADNDGVPETAFEIFSLDDHNYTNSNVVPTMRDELDGSKTCHIAIHIDQWLKNMGLETIGSLHGEFGMNETVMANVNLFPVFQNMPSATLPLEDKLNCSFSCSSNGSALEYKWNNVLDAKLKVSLIDASGKKVYEGIVTEFSGSKTIEVGSGVYFLNVQNEKEIIYVQKVLNN
jgi:hypothetical protein